MMSGVSASQLGNLLAVQPLGDECCHRSAGMASTRVADLRRSRDLLDPRPEQEKDLSPSETDAAQVARAEQMSLAHPD